MLQKQIYLFTYLNAVYDRKPHTTLIVGRDRFVMAFPHPRQMVRANRETLNKFSPSKLQMEAASHKCPLPRRTKPSHSYRKDYRWYKDTRVDSKQENGNTL